MNRVLDIFYNHIIKEAMTGRIDCFLYFNMPFSTYIYETNEKYNCGFDDSEEENLKDITPSFLVALNIALSYFRKIGITKVSIPNVLIERWNAKSMAIKKKAKVKNLSEDEIMAEIAKQNQIWVNINKKLNRTFRRLAYHTNGIK